MDLAWTYLKWLLGVGARQQSADLRWAGPDMPCWQHRSEAMGRCPWHMELGASS